MTRHKLTPRRANRVLEVTQRFLQTPHQQRIQVVRSLALAGLPRRPTDEKSLDRTLRFGAKSWVRVRYSTASKSARLPFGQDRVILTGVLHLALEQNDPVVTFERAADLLDLFDMHRGGSAYRRLKDRLGRLKGLNVDILWGERLDDLTAENEGTGMRLIVDWRLPSRKVLPAKASEQLVMFPGAQGAHYGANRQPHHVGREQQATKNDAQVINDRCQGRHQKMLMRIQSGHHHTADTEDNRRQQHHPHQRDRQRQ